MVSWYHPIPAKNMHVAARKLIAHIRTRTGITVPCIESEAHAPNRRSGQGRMQSPISALISDQYSIPCSRKMASTESPLSSAARTFARRLPS